MRKLMLVAVVSVAAAVGVAGVATAIQGAQGLTVKSTGTKAGTKAKPKSVGALTVTTTTAPVAGEPNFATKTAVIYFDKNLVFYASKFGICKKSQVEADETKCKSNSKVGQGTATALLNGAGAPVLFNVGLYSGGGTKLALLLSPAPGSAAPVRGVLDGTLTRATGAYGYKLTVLIPASLQQPAPGIYGTLTKFVTKTTSKLSKGKPYIALKGCSGGKLKYKGVFSYTDGTSKTATTTSKCKK